MEWLGNPFPCCSSSQPSEWCEAGFAAALRQLPRHLCGAHVFNLLKLTPNRALWG